MPSTKAATATAVAPKARRAPAMTERKRTPKAKPGLPVIEFDPGAHYEEIARVAYLKWLERGAAMGSPDVDWFAAETEIRAKYAA